MGRTTMVVQPDAKTGPHHHRELETVLYVLKGRVRMRWGDQLELSKEARPDDFIYVPLTTGFPGVPKGFALQLFSVSSTNAVHMSGSNERNKSAGPQGK